MDVRSIYPHLCTELAALELNVYLLAAFIIELLLSIRLLAPNAKLCCSNMCSTVSTGSVSTAKCQHLTHYFPLSTRSVSALGEDR